MTVDEMSMQAIKAYLHDHPDEIERVLSHNSSYVFFRALPAAGGPLGCFGVPVTAGETSRDLHEWSGAYSHEARHFVGDIHVEAGGAQIRHDSGQLSFSHRCSVREGKGAQSEVALDASVQHEGAGDVAGAGSVQEA